MKEHETDIQPQFLRIFWILFLLIPTWVKSQDIQFSQFYSNVLYLNPAFAGNAHAARGIFHQRLQWPALNAKYITSVVSMDNYFAKANSGVGLLVFKDWQGSNVLSSTEADLQYSYELNVSKKYSIRFGLQAGYISRYINYSILTFPDQLDDNGYTGLGTNQPFGNNKVEYLDLSSGAIFYSDKYYVGVAYNHMNRPDQSFYNSGESRLPSKYDFTAGYRFDLVKPNKHYSQADRPTREVYLTPTAHYKFQGKSDQLDGGVYLLYNQFITGFWYRGIPLFKKYRRGLQNNESIVVQIGYRINKLSICYSYDATVSKLVQARTGGSHELNLTYIFVKPGKRIKKWKRIPCPDFD